jgi:hypothetical protein
MIRNLGTVTEETRGGPPKGPEQAGTEQEGSR